MGSLYLTSLADWLRAAGCNVTEYSGWTTRSRSSGGFDSGRPWGVMWHHTASSTSPANDASYMCSGSSDKPIANLLVNRDGSVWVLAAGATNTNGKGGPWNWSKGQVPTDAMNTYCVGMEIANNGVGEAYPQVQIDAAFAASVAIVQALGLADSDICTHYAWAPTRKIDPATSSAVQGPWRPGSCTSSGTWDLNDLIDEHRRRCDAGPTPTPQEDDMTDEQASQLATVLGLVQTQSQSDATWHQTVPDAVTGQDSAMWVQVSNANSNAAAAHNEVLSLRQALVDAGVIPS